MQNTIRQTLKRDRMEWVKKGEKDSNLKIEKGQKRKELKKKKMWNNRTQKAAKEPKGRPKQKEG